jgi:hypothetical protein
VQQPPQVQFRVTNSSQMKEMLSAPHVLDKQGLLQAGLRVAVPWPVHSRLRSSSTRAALDGAPVVIVTVSPRKFGFYKLRESRVEVNVNVCVNGVSGMQLGCIGQLGYHRDTYREICCSGFEAQSPMRGILEST